MKERIVKLLEESRNSYDDDVRGSVQKEILNLGDAGLKSLKDIALDSVANINMRKEAICYIAKFNDDSSAKFIAENFVNGKDPSQLYNVYTSGEDQASFPLFREAKECLEGLGYSISSGR